MWQVVAVKHPVPGCTPVDTGRSLRIASRAVGTFGVQVGQRQELVGQRLPPRSITQVRGCKLMSISCRPPSICTGILIAWVLCISNS
jgi:hypothetical protein